MSLFVVLSSFAIIALGCFTLKNYCVLTVMSLYRSLTLPRGFIGWCM